MTFIYHLKLAYYKLTAFLYCRNHRLRVLSNEIRFIISAISRSKTLKTYTNSIKLIKTIYGDYYIRDIEIDWLMASPAFERQDKNFLFDKIADLSKQKARVVFVDIGASIGSYTVEIGRKFRNIKIFAFEPDPAVYKLLKKNVHLNRLRNTQIKKLALSSSVSSKVFYYYEPMKMLVSFFKTDKKVTIKTTTLDRELLSEISPEDQLVIKIDVEGHEYEVLKGIEKIIKKNKNIFLLLEDSGLNSKRKKTGSVFT